MSIFTSNLMSKTKSSWFPMSHSFKATLDMPFLTPVLCREVLPGDVWKISTEMFMRMMPMLAPIMQDVNVYCHYFFVPTRLLTHDYDNFFNPELQDEVFRPFLDPKKFLDYLELFPVEDPDLIHSDPAEQSTAEKNYIKFASLFSEGSLADYLGIPVFSWSEMAYPADPEDPDSYAHYDGADIRAFLGKLPKFSAYPFLMYQLIYDSFYRDQTLEESILELLSPETDGFIKGKVTLDEPFDLISPDGWEYLLTLRTRAWTKDYFTSALPTPQSGPDVHLPLTGDAPVVLDPIGEGPVVYGQQKLVVAGTGVAASSNSALGVSKTSNSLSNDSIDGDFTQDTVLDPNGTLKADMSEVTSATINELRRAVRAQEFLEKCARGGRRYIEMILSHFGVKSSDARLDRPEFLGGGRQPFTISEVLSHVGEDDDSNFVLGEMGGHGVSYGHSRPTKRSFEEHGFLFAIVSVLPNASYQQGLERQWTRETLYDYVWPVFANLGEQEIKNKEVYALAADPEGTFGYAPRYSDSKYIPSTVHGALRSSLSYWHLGRIFASTPALNYSFVHPDPEELKRIFAVQDEEQHIIAYIKHHVQCKRRLPKYGIPTL